MIDLDSIRLSYGSHESRADGMCLMEAVAYVAGEPHSDRPQCTCPVLASFGRAWNDDLPDQDRQRLLKPFVTRLVGTCSTPEVKQRRAFLATDWAVRVATPVWLHVAELDDEAAALEALPPLTSAEACHEAMPTIRRTREAALAAATPADWAAAVDAVRAAAMDAAMDASVYATEDPDVYPATPAAAVYVARTAAVHAAGAAVPAAGRDAARDVLRPHVEQLQTSAVDLFERMVEAGR